MYPYLTHYIVDDPGELSDRATKFLTEKSVRRPPEWNVDDKQEVLESYRESFNGSAVEFFEFLHYLRMRFGGLGYCYAASGFQDEIVMHPYAEIDPEDAEPYVSLVGSPHIPVAVLASMSGAVYYLAEVDEEVNIVKAFASTNSLIESAAMHDESAAWEPIARGDTDLGLIEERCGELNLVPGPSGEHEFWWEGNGIRVHVCHTFAVAHRNSSSGNWAVWAQDPSLVEEGRAFLR